MSSRTALVVTDRPAECSIMLDPLAETFCPEPGVRVYIDTMWSEDIPTKYPLGSERPGRRLSSSACPRHLWEWATEIVEYERP